VASGSGNDAGLMGTWVPACWFVLGRMGGLLQACAGVHFLLSAALGVEAVVVLCNRAVAHAASACTELIAVQLFVWVQYVHIFPAAGLCA
jgi:hypothetical protein